MPREYRSFRLTDEIVFEENSVIEMQIDLFDYIVQNWQ